MINQECLLSQHRYVYFEVDDRRFGNRKLPPPPPPAIGNYLLIFTIFECHTLSCHISRARLPSIKALQRLKSYYLNTHSYPVVFRWRADDGPTLNAGSATLCFFQGIWTRIAKKPYILWFFSEGSGPPVPPLDPHVSKLRQKLALVSPARLAEE